MWANLINSTDKNKQIAILLYSILQFITFSYAIVGIIRVYFEIWNIQIVNKMEIYPNHIAFVFIVILMEFMNWLKVPASRLTKQMPFSS